MANYPIYPGRRYGGTFDPTGYAAQRSSNTQAEIAARAEAARLLAQQKSEAELAELAARFDANKNDLLTKSNLLVMKINADKEAAKTKQDLLRRPKPIKVKEEEVGANGKLTGRTIEREVDPAEFAAAEKAKKLLGLTTKRDLLKNEWKMPWGLSLVPGKLAAVESEIAALNAPTDLLATTATNAAPPAAVAPAPTPRGFIGSPGRNTFLAEPAPLGMTRAQTNEYAINLNNQAQPAPRDLLRSESFPEGYNPSLGSFQVGAAPAPAQNDFRPVMGDVRLLKNDSFTAPIPQDAPMADFTPDAPIQDAPMADFTPDAPSFQSAEDVRAAFQAKKIDRATAKKLLAEQFDLK